MPNQIRLLHLTDFHQGLSNAGQPTFWQTIKAEFLADLPRVAKAMGGPIDLILFTGDLTQSGTPEQFVAFSATLQEIVEGAAAANLHLYGKQFLHNQTEVEPIVLAVPGNHDLRWLPDPRDAEPYAKYYDSANDESWRRGFWDNHSYRRTIINERFKDYSDWLDSWYARNRRPVFSGNTANRLMVGDFSATVTRNAFRLHIVGLNSAFLHLTRDDAKGKLDVAAEQLNAVVDKDWRSGHHAHLLMTHHPVDWLSSRSQKAFRQHVYLPTNFAAHLHGHMHVPKVVGEIVSARAWYQGAALFSAEPLADGGCQRIFGYSAIQIGPLNGATGLISAWPRQARQHEGSDVWQMLPDNSANLLTDTGRLSQTHSFDLLAPFHMPGSEHRSEQTPSTALSDDLDAFYVHDEQAEQRIIKTLQRETGRKSILIDGPPLSGKKSLWQQAKKLYCDRLDPNRKCQFIHVHLENLDYSNWETFLREFAEKFMRQTSMPEEDISKACLKIAQSPNPKSEIENQLESLLKSTNSPIVLELSQASLLWSETSLDHAKAAFRTWIENSNTGKPGWRRLRVVGLYSTFHAPAHEKGSALFPLFERISVPRLDLNKITFLAKRYNTSIPPNPKHLFNLWKYTGGHAGIIRAVFDLCSHNDDSRIQVTEHNVLRAADGYINQLITWLEQQNNRSKRISSKIDIAAGADSEKSNIISALRALIRAPGYNVAAKSLKNKDDYIDLCAYHIAYYIADDESYQLANEIIAIVIKQKRLL